MNKLRAMKNKKGFTLVEIIVVLVILAILAAFGIPSMIGFINDARGKAYVSEARAVYVAAQAIVTEDQAATASKITGTDDAARLTAFNTAYATRMKDMLDPDIKYTAGTTITTLVITSGKVDGLIYVSSNTSGTFYVALASGSPAEVFNGTDATTIADAKSKAEAALAKMLT